MGPWWMSMTFCFSNKDYSSRTSMVPPLPISRRWIDADWILKALSNSDCVSLSWYTVAGKTGFWYQPFGSEGRQLVGTVTIVVTSHRQSWQFKKSYRRKCDGDDDLARKKIAFYAWAKGEQGTIDAVAGIDSAINRSVDCGVRTIWVVPAIT